MMPTPLNLLLSVFALLAFASCAQDTRDWQMQDPNDGATIAGDISNPRNYTTDSECTEQRALEGWEERGTSGKNGTRFSGEVSLGVGANF